MGVLDKVKSAWKGEKEELVTPSEEKKQAAAIREASETLTGAMQALILSDGTGRIPKEAIDNYKMVIRGLVNRLDRASVSLLDTRSLDKSMVHLTQHLDIAVRDGRQDTADRILKALIYGVGKGHEQVPSGDWERVEEIMEEREKRLGQYRTIVEYSEKVDERRRSIEQQQIQHEKVKKDFEKARKKVLEEAERNPHLVEMINQYGDSVKDIHVDAYNLVVKQKEVVKLYNNLKALKQQMAMNETTIVSCNQIIRSEENALTEMAQKVEQEMIDDVIRHEAEFRNHLVDLQKQIGKLEELSDRFGDAIAEIFSSPIMGDYIINTILQYEEMEKEIKREEEDCKEGMRLMQERQQEAMNEESVIENSRMIHN